MEELDQTVENNVIASKFGNRSRRRSSVSLFDLVIDVVPAEKLKKTEYEENLQNEAKDWNTLLKDKTRDVERAEKEKRKVDKSVLTDAQRSYLDKMPDLQRFVRESEEFCNKACSYLHENEEIVTMHERLVECCKESLDEVAAGIIYECLYKHRSIAP